MSTGPVPGAGGFNDPRLPVPPTITSDPSKSSFAPPAGVPDPARSSFAKA